MSASPERALLAAVRTQLLADAGVRAAFGDPPRLYDERPTAADYPCATFGGVQTRPVGAAGSEALEHVFGFNVWSRYGGRAEALDALEALRGALDDRPPTVEGRRIVMLYASYAEAFRLGDGRTIHGVLRLRAITEPLEV